jgi:hypothetical protein
MRFTSLLLTAIAFTGAVPALAATSLSGSMNLTAFASMAGGTKTATDTDSDSFSGAPAVMGVFAVATATDGTTGGLLTAIGQGISSGTANSGSIHFQNYGWTFGAPDRADRDELVSLNDHSGGPDWSYTFTADHAGTIDLDYDVFLTDGTAGGSAFGLWGWSIGWTGTGGGMLPGGTAFDPTASGVFSRALVGGETYTISLFNGTNVSTPESFQPGTDPLARMSGNFVYTIRDSVPEPASWALMISGFGWVGGAMRRRAHALA